MPFKRVFYEAGHRQGRLVVLASPSPSSIDTTDFVCDCGAKINRITHRARGNRIKACTECARHMRGVRPWKFFNVGERVGGLTVIASPSTEGPRSSSDFVCICGRRCTRNTVKVRSRHESTCGCRQRTAMVPVGEKIGQFVFRGECKPIDKKAIGKHGVFVCDCGRENVASFASVVAGRKKCRCTPHPKRKPDGVAEINTVFSMYRSRAISVGRQFTLSVQRFTELVAGCCHYCGVPPCVSSKDTVRTGIREEIRRKWASRMPRNGIDRVDNSLGYIEGNVVSCCRTCNIAKATMTRDEFISWIDRAAAHLGLGRGWVAA